MSHYFEAINDEGIVQITDSANGVYVSRYISADLKNGDFALQYNKDVGEFMCAFRVDTYALGQAGDYILGMQDAPNGCTFVFKLEGNFFSKASCPIKIAVFSTRPNRIEHGAGLEIYNENGQVVYSSLRNGLLCSMRSETFDYELDEHFKTEHYPGTHIPAKIGIDGKVVVPALDTPDLSAWFYKTDMDATGNTVHLQKNEFLYIPVFNFKDDATTSAEVDNLTGIHYLGDSNYNPKYMAHEGYLTSFRGNTPALESWGRETHKKIDAIIMGVV